MDLMALADFNLVATHGGFGRASRAGKRPKATLSRRVAELEAALGVRLVERGARSLRLTEAGTALHARTKHLLDEVADAAELVRDGLDQPRGRLRVSAPVLFSHMALGRIAAGFVARHPAVRLEIVADDRIVDPVEDGFDIVIRINPRPDVRMIGRCLFRDDQLLVMHPSLAPPEAGMPATLPAVVRSADTPPKPWRIRDGARHHAIQPAPILCLSSLPMVRDAVLAGAGAALLPASMVQADIAAGRLVCQGVADAPPAEIWVLHTSRRLVSRKVTAFLDHLAATVAPEA